MGICCQALTRLQRRYHCLTDYRSHVGFWHQAEEVSELARHWVHLPS
jgi:hypothetical protein